MSRIVRGGLSWGLARWGWGRSPASRRVHAGRALPTNVLEVNSLRGVR